MMSRVACVLAVLVLQLGGAVHLAQVRHATCLEHGESIELSEHATAGRPRVAIDAAHHDHCERGACLRHSGSRQTRPLPVLAWTHHRRPTPPLAPRHAPIPLLLLAPKASPPLA